MSAPSRPPLERIAAALGMSAEAVASSVPTEPPRDWLHIDGTPDRFEIWADQVLDPQARLRLKKISAILVQRKEPAL